MSRFLFSTIGSFAVSIIITSPLNLTITGALGLFAVCAFASFISTGGR